MGATTGSMACQLLLSVLPSNTISLLSDSFEKESSANAIHSFSSAFSTIPSSSLRLSNTVRVVLSIPDGLSQPTSSYGAWPCPRSSSQSATDGSSSGNRSYLGLAMVLYLAETDITIGARRVIH